MGGMWGSLPEEIHWGTLADCSRADRRLEYGWAQLRKDPKVLGSIPFSHTPPRQVPDMPTHTLCHSCVDP